MKKFFLASIVVDPVLFFLSFPFLEGSNSSDTGKISSNLLYTYGDKISLRRSWKVSQGQMDKFRRRCLFKVTCREKKVSLSLARDYM